jgi:20S proteasome subunit alpha 4
VVRQPSTSALTYIILTRTNYRKANAIGRSSKTVREFLERNHQPDLSRADTIELAIKSLLEVVQTGAKNIEIAIMAPGKEIEMLAADEIEKIVEKINTEKDAEASQRRGGRGAGTGSAQGPEQVLASRPAGEGTGPAE